MPIYLSLFIIYCQYLFDFISHLEEGLNFQLPPLPEAEVSPNLHLFAAGRPIHRLTDTFPTIFASLKPNFQLNLNIFATVGTLMRRKWNHLYRSPLQVQRQQNWIELHLNLNCLTEKEIMVVHNVHGCGASGSSNFQWTELSGLHPCLLLNILLNILEQIRIDVERKVVDYVSALNAWDLCAFGILLHFIIVGSRRNSWFPL